MLDSTQGLIQTLCDSEVTLEILLDQW
jgi:hypothetical protein